MAKFCATGSKGAASVRTVLGLNVAATGMRRIRLSEFTIGTPAAPTDVMVTWAGQFTSTSPTGSTVTIGATDRADTLAATTVVKDTVTADPTFVSNWVFGKFPLYTRSTYRWLAQTDFEICTLATANEGISLGLFTADVLTATATAFFEEI